MEEERSRLADLIEKHAISYSNEPFTLASGAKSNFYFDLRQVSGDAEGITAIARILYNMITEIGGIKSVGGLESGSISLAAAISQYSYTKNPSSPLTSFYVRKQAKSHGAKKRIEGRPQSPVAIVDDVITSGGSAVEALNAGLFLDLLQNQELPVFLARSSASLLAYAKVRTLSVSASCTITGTMPPLFAKSISPISFSMHKADSCTL